MKNRRVPYNDADYLDSLSPADRDYYLQFIAEHYFGRQPKNRNEAILPQTTQRVAWREQHAQRRDYYWRAERVSDFLPALTYDPVDSIIELLDAMRTPQLPLMVRGENMSDEKPSKEEKLRALEMFKVAIACVSGETVKVAEAEEKLQCLLFLRSVKANIEKELAA